MRKHFTAFVPVSAILLNYRQKDTEVGKFILAKIDNLKSKKLQAAEGSWSLISSWKDGYDTHIFKIEIKEGDTLYDLCVQVCLKFEQAFGYKGENLLKDVTDGLNMILQGPIYPEVCTPSLETIELNHATKTITHQMSE